MSTTGGHRLRRPGRRRVRHRPHLEVPV